MTKSSTLISKILFLNCVAATRHRFSLITKLLQAQILTFRSCQMDGDINIAQKAPLVVGLQACAVNAT